MRVWVWIIVCGGVRYRIGEGREKGGVRVWKGVGFRIGEGKGRSRKD